MYGARIKEINERTLLPLTKLIKLAETSTKDKHANEKIIGVIIWIIYNKFNNQNCI
jgi:hypothetical protein